VALGMPLHAAFHHQPSPYINNNIVSTNHCFIPRSLQMGFLSVVLQTMLCCECFILPCAFNHALFWRRHYSSSLVLASDKSPCIFSDNETKLNKKHPCFPSAIPVNSTDVKTLIHQTNQMNPSNAVLGKPSRCRCIHGYTQAFSLDPIPHSNNRLNSGLLKLTCPLLVNSIDELEDDGFIGKINQMLQREACAEGVSSMFKEFMNDAHIVNAESRRALIDDSYESVESSPRQIIENKLGKQGAEYFMNAGVAGANPETEKPDVKCLHAWMADYLFRKVVVDDASTISCNNNSVEGPGTTRHHPIGELIKDALSERGININGTENCNMVCSGMQTRVGQFVFVPTPRNKQRKRSVKEIERRGRIRKRHDLINNTLLLEDKVSLNNE
jgi:hypothetical protein